MGLAAKTVVVILAFLSVYSIAIMLDRGFLLRRTRQQSGAFAELVDTAERLSIDEVMALASDPERGKNCYLGQVVLEALQESKLLLDQGHDAAAVLETAQAAVTRSITMTVAILRKRLVQLASTASGAPFLGLFGTVLGLIRAFQTIATTGSGGITSVSAGIAEALITTLVGLFVAIPALWAHNLIADRIDTLVVELDSTATRVVERLLRQELSERNG
jgi:biopolymer transport protein ExbB/biopolymer transport protein TolQ